MSTIRESKREKQKRARHDVAPDPAAVAHLKYPAFEGPVVEIEEIKEVPAEPAEKKAKKVKKKKKKKTILNGN